MKVARKQGPEHLPVFDTKAEKVETLASMSSRARQDRRQSSKAVAETVLLPAIKGQHINHTCVPGRSPQSLVLGRHSEKAKEAFCNLLKIMYAE